MNEFLIIFQLTSVIPTFFLYICQQIIKCSYNKYQLIKKIFVQKSSFITFIILISFTFAANSQGIMELSPPILCTETSGVNVFNIATGPDAFAASKVLQAVDSNLEANINGQTTELTTVYLAYFIQNPSANVYNLIIQVTESNSGDLSRYTQVIASDQTFVMAQGGLVVMKQGTTNLNLYLLYQDTISQIISLPSSDIVFTSQIVSIVHSFGTNHFQFLYYDSSTQNLYPSSWDSSSYNSFSYNTAQALIPSIPSTSIFIFSRYSFTNCFCIFPNNSLRSFWWSTDLAKRDLNYLSYMTNFYYGNILSISTSDSVFTAMYDQTSANSHLFELRHRDNGAFLTFQLISTPNVAGTLKSFTDSKTAFAQADATNNVVAFYFVSSIDFGQLSFFYKADSTSNPDHITEIVSDFVAAESVSFNIDGTLTIGTQFDSILQAFLLKSDSIVRYSIQMSYPIGGSATYTINKDYQVEIGSHLQTALAQNNPGTFQLKIDIGCVCTSKSIIRFICFSGTQCLFTVQNSQIDCTAAS